MLVLALALASVRIAIADLLVPLQTKSDADACKGGVTKGAIGIGGVPSAYMAGENGTVQGSTLTLQHNSGMSVLSSCERTWKPDSIMQFKLLGRTLRFTVDLSRVGCGCNLAFYLISSPALDMLGKPHAGSDREGQPPYYCDANKVGGQWCPEVDIMEANTHAFQATLHKCDKPTNGHYEYCDRSGCAENTRDIPRSYGHGEHFTINTQHPFEVHTEFLEDAGELTGMRTVLKQASSYLVMNHSNCHGHDLSAMSAAMRHGMSVRATYWGGDAQTMAWMDAPPCGHQACKGENAGDGIISDISVSEKVWEHFEAPQDERTQWSQASAVSSWQQPRPWKAQDQEQQHRQQQEQGQSWHSWQPQEQNPWKPEEQVPMQWAADEWAPWECHHYVDSEQQKSDWCADVGFSDGYEFHYNGGAESECSPCWCCKRRAKQVPVETAVVHTTGQLQTSAAASTTTTTATSTTITKITSTTTVPAWQNRLVWVVNDPSDSMVGRIVPESIIADPTLFVFDGDEGMVKWEHKGRFVRKMKGSQIETLLEVAKRFNTGSSSPDDHTKAGKDCDDDGGAPCQTSIRSEASYFGLVLRKYAQVRLPDVGGAAAAYAPAVGFAAVLVTLLVFGVARAHSRLGWQPHYNPVTSSGMERCLAGVIAGSGPVDFATAVGVTGCSADLTSPPRPSRSAPVLGSPDRPQAGSSCEQLLLSVENLA